MSFDEVDLMDIPSAARMYDYLLGGSYNFPADRETAERALVINPDMRKIVVANRTYLCRAVRYLLDQGIDQFLEVGSGLATAGNVHEMVQATNPTARVVYVDIDPVAYHLNLAILKDNPLAAAIRADARQPEQILSHPQVRSLLDFDRPVAVLLLALLHFVTDDAEAYATVRALRTAISPGSYLAISHATYDDTSRAVVEGVERVTATTANPHKSRERDQIIPFFDGLDLVPPGLVHAPLWRPESSMDILLDHPERSVSLVGVGQKL